MEATQLIAALAENDTWVSDLRFHPSDWDRAVDAKEKMRERRPEIIGAFDVAMNAVGRNKELAAEQLGFIAATAINAGTQLGLDMTAELARRADAEDAGGQLRDEVAAVLDQLDGLAATWGDEGVFRRCRDRLREALER